MIRSMTTLLEKQLEDAKNGQENNSKLAAQVKKFFVSEIILSPENEKHNIYRTAPTYRTCLQGHPVKYIILLQTKLKKHYPQLSNRKITTKTAQ